MSCSYIEMHCTFGQYMQGCVAFSFSLASCKLILLDIRSIKCFVFNYHLFRICNGGCPGFDRKSERRMLPDFCVFGESIETRLSYMLYLNVGAKYFHFVSITGSHLLWNCLVFKRRWWPKKIYSSWRRKRTLKRSRSKIKNNVAIDGTVDSRQWAVDGHVNRTQ